MMIVYFFSIFDNVFLLLVCPTLTQTHSSWLLNLSYGLGNNFR